MLSTPKFTRMQFLHEGIFSHVCPAAGKPVAIQGLKSVEGVWNYGRLAGSDEHSPGVAIPGSESGHALQVRRRAKDSRFQAGQPLALQEIEAGPVDGREVNPDGSERQEETEGGW